MTYVNNFGEYVALRGINITELPEGLRATSSDGGVYEITEGSWRHVGVSDPWVPDDDLSNYYRIDHDPLAPPFEYLGHVYAEGDEVEFLHEGRWIRTTLRLERYGLRSSDAWDTGYYEPLILSPSGRLHSGIDGLRPYGPEPMADWERDLSVDDNPENLIPGPETLHTIDCHGIDPAIIQDYLDGYIAHREAAAEAEALAEKARAIDDRARDLFGRHCANRESLRAALDAAAQAAA